MLTFRERRGWYNFVLITRYVVFSSFSVEFATESTHKRTVCCNARRFKYTIIALSVITSSNKEEWANGWNKTKGKTSHQVHIKRLLLIKCYYSLLILCATSGDFQRRNRRPLTVRLFNVHIQFAGETQPNRANVYSCLKIYSLNSLIFRRDNVHHWIHKHSRTRNTKH